MNLMNVPPGYLHAETKPQLSSLGLMMSPQINPLTSRQPQSSQHQLINPLNQAIPMIKEVWAENVEEEMAIVRELISNYNYITISTDFPGILARPMGSFRSIPDFHYQTMRSNADLLKLIQLSISLTDAAGKKPEGIPSVWQFNFKFDLDEDMFAGDTIKGLIDTGVNFARHKEFGIDVFEFSQLLTDSGLCLVDDVHWISYHAGYDFGFLISLLTNNQMPQEEPEFFWWVEKYFPNLYDVKVLANMVRPQPNNTSANLQTMKSSIETLADDLRVPRLPNLISCGYMSFLTHLCFRELTKLIPDVSQQKGMIWGFSNCSSGELQGGEDMTPNGLQSPRGMVHYGRAM